MKNKLVLLLLAFLVSLGGCSQQAQDAIGAEPRSASPESVEPVLQPSVAGAFYPANPVTLRNDIKRYLDSAKPPEVQGEAVAVIVPHAGYVYSAPVAAYAYKVLSRQATPEAVIVLAFDHRGRYPGVSVYPKGAVATPLGQKAVAEDIAHEFMKADPALVFTPRVFAGEHSLEVQIPFLQTVLPDVPVVPVIFGRQSSQDIETVVRALEAVAAKHHVIVVATTDLSHYNPYARAKAFDSETVGLMAGGDAGEMARYMTEHPDRMCGPAPVLAAMSFATHSGATPVLLKYANSGDTAGGKDAVVGYAAVAFVKKTGATTSVEKAEPTTSSVADESAHDSEYLTGEEKRTLLRLARRSIESLVRDHTLLVVDPPESTRLREAGAAFVTLKRDGQLRGCIGSMQAVMPLYQTVIQMAAAAASRDTRFPPVRPEELDDIHIEISVNTPLTRVSGPDDIILGTHGVVVSQGSRQGVFLPQVATETGWSKEKFLSNLCMHKAGLPPDAYKNGADIFVFTSVIFEEER
jgi:AmmeMemoRadiSam system protein B/AmmeMemoRadiSam system protein A